MRSADLGFLRQWFAPAENAKPGEYAGGWSQRLIFSYIGYRIFIDRPVLGTGWWGELPPSEYARFSRTPVPAFLISRRATSRRRRARSSRSRPTTRSSTSSGSSGSLAFARARGDRRSVPQRDRPALAARDDDELAVYLPAAWLASLAGTLAGSALFGGTPIAALFWVTLGLVGAVAAIGGQPEREAATA